MSTLGKPIERKNRLVGAGGGEGLLQDFFWGGDENILEFDCGDGHTPLNILETTDLQTSKLSKWCFLCYMNFITIEK
jgi:hypothetical protein